MGTLTCPICNATGMDVDQLKIHFGTEHPNPSPFRCLKCQSRFVTVELLKKHKVDVGHSDESEEVRMAQVWASLSNLVTSASDFRNLVDRFHAKNGHSEGADILAACVNNISTACETAGIVGLKEVLKPIGVEAELFRDEPSVSSRDKVPGATGVVSCLICDTQVEAEQLNGHINSQHLKSLPFRCQFSTSTLELLMKHQAKQGHSEEEDKTVMGLWWQILQTFLIAACEIRDGTLDVVKSYQAERGHSSGAGHIPTAIDKETYEDFVKFNSDAADRMETIVILIRSDQLESHMQLVRSDTGLNTTEESREKSAQKRPASMSDSAEITAKRRRDGSAQPQTESAHGSVVTNEVETDNSAADKTPLSSTFTGGLSISSLTNRLANNPPSQVLLDVILQMKRQLENVEVLKRCQQLIDQYHSDQLKQLELPMRRNLTEVLLSAVKLHSGDSLIVKSSCDLLEKIGVAQRHIDWYWEAIGFLLDICCDENLTSMARRSTLHLMTLIAFMCEADVEDEHFVALVKKVCRSIVLQLDKCEYDELMAVNWRCLWCLCWLSVGSRKTFVDAGGISLFQQCYEKFGDQDYLVLQMTMLMDCVGSNESFRQDLMTDVNFKIFWEIWMKTNDSMVGVSCLHLFKAFLTQTTVKWPLNLPTRVEVEQKLTSVMLDMSKGGTCRQALVITGDMKFLWKLWNDTEVTQISSNCAKIFTNLSSDSSLTWPVGHPTKEQVEQMLAVGKTVG